MTLQELIALLEGAEGPALQLDGQIWCAVNGYEFVMWDGAGCVYRDPAAPKWDTGIKHAQASIVRPYSASVDAAIALAEKVLPPEFCNSTIRTGDNKFAAYVWQTPAHPDVLWSPTWNVENVTSSRAIALCIATLQALRALQAKTGDR